MSYFRELPNLQYLSPLADRNNIDEYVLTKNIFRRVKLRDDIKKYATLYYKYEIPDGSRPDLVAEALYGAADLDWVVLITAGILNVRDEWPLSNYQLYKYAEEKYGVDLNAVRFYETTEVLDSKGRLILPSGKVVDSGFTIPNPNQPTATLNPVVGVSNYEYEVRKNDEKRTIYVLRKTYLQQFLNESRKLMLYSDSTQYVDETTIKSQNIRIQSP